MAAKYNLEYCAALHITQYIIMLHNVPPKVLEPDAGQYKQLRDTDRRGHVSEFLQPL